MKWSPPVMSTDESLGPSMFACCKKKVKDSENSWGFPLVLAFIYRFKKN